MYCVFDAGKRCLHLLGRTWAEEVFTAVHAGLFVRNACGGEWRRGRQQEPRFPMHTFCYFSTGLLSKKNISNQTCVPAVHLHHHIATVRIVVAGRVRTLRSQPKRGLRRLLSLDAQRPKIDASTAFGRHFVQILVAKRSPLSSRRPAVAVLT